MTTREKRRWTNTSLDEAIVSCAASLLRQCVINLDLVGT